MKALTLWQPWASLIMEGVKPYEFRRWPAPRALWGQRIVIHAGARPVRRAEVADLMARFESDREGTGLIGGRAADLLDAVWKNLAILPLAAGLGTAVLGEPRKATDLYPDSDRVDHHIWGWPLTEIERWEPVRPARGFQGLWPWDKAA